MNCQVKTAKAILDKGGEYLLALKGNHEYLEQRVQEKFIQKSGPGSRSVKRSSCTTKKKEHGRIEKITCTVLTKKEGKSLGVNPLENWPSLNSIVEIRSERASVLTGAVSTEKRYYITSLEAPSDEILGAVRSHWEVENKLHWVLDVVFREDDCRSRTGYSPENFSAIRQFALNLIKQEPSKKSIKRKQNLAGWDEEFLLRVLLGGVI